MNQALNALQKYEIDPIDEFSRFDDFATVSEVISNAGDFEIKNLISVVVLKSQLERVTHHIDDSELIRKSECSGHLSSTV